MKLLIAALTPGAFGGVLVTLAGLAPVYKSMRQQARRSDGAVIY